MDNYAENSTSFPPHSVAYLTDALFFQNVKSDPGFWINSAAGFTLFVFGLPLNTWVLGLIVKDTGERVGSEIFPLSLTAMELYYCLISPLTWVSIYFSTVPLFLFLMFFIGFFMAGQPMLQCCICADRYLAVVHPIIFLKYKPVRYKVMCLGAVGLIAVGFGILTVLQSPGFPIYPLSAVCVAVLAVSLFCSVAILKVLRQPGPGDGEREEMNSIKRRAFTTVLVILVMTVVNYFPFPVVGIVCLNGLIPEKYLQVVYGIAYCLFMSGSVVQPLLHLKRAGKLPCCRRFW